MSYPGSEWPHYRRRGSGAGAAVTVVLMLVCIVGIIVGLVSYNTTHNATVTVCSKERVAVDGGGEYRIYTTEGTYVMADSLLGATRFNTADAYGKIQPSTTYKIEYKGWRVPFFSMFPNILRATVVGKVPPAVCSAS